ncbi:MAG: hypothetical protein AB9869_32800 [Verrucomicrobiia bacterium]
MRINLQMPDRLVSFDDNGIDPERLARFIHANYPGAQNLLFSNDGGRAPAAARETALPLPTLNFGQQSAAAANNEEPLGLPQMRF